VAVAPDSEEEHWRPCQDTACAHDLGNGKECKMILKVFSGSAVEEEPGEHNLDTNLILTSWTHSKIVSAPTVSFHFILPGSRLNATRVALSFADLLCDLCGP